MINNLMPRVSNRMTEALVDVFAGKSIILEAAKEHKVSVTDLDRRLSRLHYLYDIMCQWDKLKSQ